MKKSKKISLTRYIYIRFTSIILIMAVIMILFISYFSNKTIFFDIRRQIRRESRYDFLNIDVKNKKILVNKDFVFRENHIQKIVLDENDRVIRGYYPDEELAKYPLHQWDFRRVKCSSGYYYIFDRPFLKQDSITKKRVLVIIRNIGKETDFNSQYQTMKYISYLFTFIISLIDIILIGITSLRLTIPMKEIRDTANKIGADGDLAKRINYSSPFKEMDAMIQANNRMMDRLEDLFQQQQQFTSDVAHELRTPASIISAECQYLNKYGKAIEDYEDSLNVIHRQITKTNEIIMQLLQLSRLEQGRIKEDFEYTNLKDLIESVCDSEPLREKKHITIYSNLNDISISMNVGLMTIAIKNLINNAMKYSEDNSSVKLRLWVEKNHVFFEVKDYGCGMSEETQKHIYDRFYRADKSRNTEGFGLGLALVHKIIEIHKGEIFVKSELGEGSVFTITLPQH
nr:HAMP domain-containing sensor histidine kinase [uncultured Anaerobutyricum sp.]